jgi:arylsulfatase A-like enzyme
MLQVDIPKTPLDGTNIMPLLKGGSIAERALIWHFPIYLQAYNPNNDQGRDPLFRTRPGTTIRWKQWKLLQYFEDNTIELYNLETDLGEQHNIVEDHPDIKKLLLDKIKTWQLENNAPIPTQLNPKYDSVYHHQLIKNYQNNTH